MLTADTMILSLFGCGTRAANPSLPLHLHANVVRLGRDNGEMFLHENEDGSDWIVESLDNHTYV